MEYFYYFLFLCWFFAMLSIMVYVTIRGLVQRRPLPTRWLWWEVGAATVGLLLLILLYWNNNHTFILM